MSEQLDLMELAQRAQQGDKVALDRLAEIAAKRLRVYVYRLTLQDDLAQDIVQETMLEMMKILGKLKRTDRFLPWLYGIATNKLRHYYRSEATQRRATASKSERERPIESREDGLQNLLGQELKEIITTAIQGLKTRHRAVLIMRCYDGMSYAEIAESMDSTEFGSRMLFIRAKKALEKQLSRNGLGKGTLLSSLVLFGKMTAPSEAAAAEISITAATTNVGLAATAVGAMTSTSGIVSLAAAGALTVGTVVAPQNFLGLGDAIEKPVVASSFLPDTQRDTDSTESSYFYMPKGRSGPLMLRAHGYSDGSSEWNILQNGYANYLYDGKTVYVRNQRAWSPAVLRSATDSPELEQFLSKVTGVSRRADHVSSRVKGGLLVSIEDTPSEPEVLVRVENRDNVDSEDFFQYNWPVGIEQKEMRDPMHARGWTYFKVEGLLRGEKIDGSGRIPFLYNKKFDQLSPWIKLTIGDLSIVDCRNGSMARIAGQGAQRYSSGTFFSGFTRPWMGYHAIDTVRRDAAAQRIWFETDIDEEQEIAVVVLTLGQIELKYTIDIENDLIQRIDMFEENRSIGMLLFEYLQDIGHKSGEFVAPRLNPASKTVRGNPGITWFEKLANGSLIK
jgi:RNA polymerase sigma-70 factor, ECF subfamily